MKSFEINLLKISENNFLIAIFTFVFKTSSFIFVTIPFGWKHSLMTGTNFNVVLFDAFIAYLIGMIIGFFLAKYSLKFVVKYGARISNNLSGILQKFILRENFNGRHSSKIN